jgi:hypothetical protein
MSVYKRGEVYHYDFTVNGRRFRGSTEVRSKTAAKLIEARERERAALGGLYRHIPTIEEAAAQWFRSRAEHRRSVTTIAHRVKIALRHIDGAQLVTEIGTPEIEAAVQARRLEETHNGRAPTNATVNRDMIDSTLRPILRYCADVLELPVRRIAWTSVRLPEPKGRTRTFTPAELAAWRAGLPHWHRPLFDFLSLYGVRLREAFFHPDAFNAETGEVCLTGRKSGTDLMLPLLEEDALAIAARAGRARKAGLETVWFKETRDGIAPLHWRAFQSASRVALEAANIRDARPAHDLRHHAGTAVRRHGDLSVAKELLGHDDIRSTARYAHTNKADVLRALRHAKGANDVTSPETCVKTIGDTGT